MELKKNEKIFLITISGLMTEKDSVSYIEELEKNISYIDPRQYSIIVDTRELIFFPKQFIELREQAKTLITTTPFKKRCRIAKRYNNYVVS